MAVEPDPKQLRDLEARLAAARARTEPKAPAPARAFSQGEAAWRMVIELVTGLLIGAGIGYGLDRVFGTIPLFLALFSVLGFAAGVRTMMRTAATLARDVPEGTGRDGGDGGKGRDGGG